MMGIAQPLERSEEDFFSNACLGTPDNLAEQDAICMQRHVVPVLLVSGNRKNYRCISGQRGNFGPFHFDEFHVVTRYRPKRVV